MIDEAVRILCDVQKDRGVPCNVRTSIEEVLKILSGSGSKQERVSTVVSLLDEVSCDPNISMPARTQLWSAVSELEG